MLAMIAQILNAGHFRVLRQHQPCLKDRTKIIWGSLISGNTFLKDTSMVNTIATMTNRPATAVATTIARMELMALFPFVFEPSALFQA